MQQSSAIAQNIVIIISSAEDVAHLPAAARVIGKLAPVGLWVVSSPALCVDEKAATAEIDKEIAANRKAESEACRLGDYDTAKKHKAEIEKLEVNRSIEIRNAWKRVQPKDRQAATTKILRPFWTTINPENKQIPTWRVSGAMEHHDAKNWLTAINELKAHWPDYVQAGDFTYATPKQLAAMEPNLKFDGTCGGTVIDPVFADVKTREMKPASHPPFSREEQLRKMPFFTLKSEAKKFGVDTAGKKAKDIIPEILAAEAKAAA